MAFLNKGKNERRYLFHYIENLSAEKEGEVWTIFIIYKAFQKRENENLN